VSYSTEWHRSGACATADPDLFYPIATPIIAAGQTSEARRICAVCQVRRQCLDYAMETREAHGIWGGTTPEERSRARRKEANAQRYALRNARRTAPETAA
jgi:WhiB family redox-sensing transcriptional regulator